jgi:hypothetical protein
VGGQQFENRRHFFAAAAQSMRRILVEKARGLVVAGTVLPSARRRQSFPFLPTFD